MNVDVMTDIRTAVQVHNGHQNFFYEMTAWYMYRALWYMHTHYSDVMMSAMASQITSVSIVCSIVHSGADQIKHQSSASLAFVRGIRRSPVNSPHKGPVTRKMFPIDDVIMVLLFLWLCYEFLVYSYRWLSARLQCLVHRGVRDKRRVSEIDLSQPRHETAFWWRHNGPVTSQLTGPNKWPYYPLQLIVIYVHINTHNKESLTQWCCRSTNVQLCLIFLYISKWFES